MAAPILSDDLQSRRAEVDELVKDLHQLTIDIGHQDLARTVSELRNRLHEPFMFVIVGEVKAGKSSFINALLKAGRRVVEVAPDPCTDTIQQVVYGDSPREVMLNDFLKRIELPIDILREIAIVDTPGTNTIEDNHQQITEDFVPASDLIVFVFEAKNPYRQSAWDFLDYIRGDWRKKVIFILQQKDLATDEELEVNIQGVKNYATKKGIEDPQVFAVSAKLELEEKPDSGYKTVRAYIRDKITGGKAPFLKLENNLETADNIVSRIRSGLADRHEQYDSDRTFRKEVDDTLGRQTDRSNNHVDLLLESLLGEYDRVTADTRKELADGMGFFSLVSRSFKSTFGSGPGVKKWLTELRDGLELKLSERFDQKLRQGTTDLAESIQQMARLIAEKIKNSRTVLRDNHEIFGNIAEQRSEILRELQERFVRFMNREENFLGKDIFDSEANVTSNLMTGGGLAVVGIVLAAVTQGMVLDVTGGVLSAVGLLFAGITVSLKRRKILGDFDAEIAKGRQRLADEIGEKLRAYVTEIRSRIVGNFADFDAYLEAETESLTQLDTRVGAMESRVSDLQGTEK